MLAVSNTSPISNLAILGRLDLLQHRYGKVFIPPTVDRELARLSHADGKTRIAKAQAAGWLEINFTATDPLRLPIALDDGETAAIALALKLKADVLLMDEKRGRMAARHVGLAVAGILGELLHARMTGSLPSLKPELLRLRMEAKFFIDAEIERFILSQVGE
jgi:predicted nucleic acid-binding protein